MRVRRRSRSTPRAGPMSPAPRVHGLPHGSGDRRTYNGGPSTPSSRSSPPQSGSLDFSTYLGGSSDDRGYGIAVNGATGRIYAAGQTDSSGSFPTTAGAFDTSYNGGFDAFVTKLSPAGSTLTRREEPAVVQQSLPDSTGYAQRLDQRAAAEPPARHRPGRPRRVPLERRLGADSGPGRRARGHGPEPASTRTSRPSCSDPCYSTRRTTAPSTPSSPTRTPSSAPTPTRRSTPMTRSR